MVCTLNQTVFGRYLGLFGDHIVPAVLYRYTQVLRRPDLLNSKGKPLVSNERLEAVWKRLSDRFSTVVVDTSMIIMSTAYAAHFHDIYIDGKENAKMTGDRMKMLMLTLPFMVRDLIAPEVKLINSAIDNAKHGSRLRRLPHVTDPSPDVVDVLIQCMDWNMASRQSRIPQDELAELHDKAVDLLDLLKQKLPDKTGEKSGWNFEKAHSILH